MPKPRAMASIPAQSVGTWFVDKDGTVLIDKKWWRTGRKNWTVVDTGRFLKIIEQASAEQVERGGRVH